MNAIYKILTYPFRRQVERATQHIERNINNTPTHCGMPMEYIGEHSGFYSNTQFYQCKKCKQLIITHMHEWEK